MDFNMYWEIISLNADTTQATHLTALQQQPTASSVVLNSKHCLRYLTHHAAVSCGTHI